MAEVKSGLLFGSVQQDNPTSTSDLDFFAIVRGEETWNFRRTVDGVVVEVYFLPYQLCVRNLERADVIFVRAFSSGTALLDLDGEIAKLSEMAIKIYDAGPKPIDALQKNNLRIHISDSIRDPEGLSPNTPESRMLSASAIDSC